AKAGAQTPAFFRYVPFIFSLRRLLIAICTVAKGPRQTVLRPRDGFSFQIARYLFQIGGYVFQKVGYVLPKSC
ncbi:MAG TPA: hypothetical protein PK026_03830, partial [Bacteroides graminisolvens]|nr:hypothetical protein [Bacteroides graminisolvens]